MKEFYPTPEALAFRAIKKFKNKDFKRVLEPSAGRGDLLDVLNKKYRMKSADCIELDLNNQAVLRAKKYRVVDSDFASFSGAPIYSHIIMNPPFSVGAEHVNKAFDLLVNGELVAIVNAETIKNPYSSERKMLLRRINDCGGDVEFVDGAFTDPDTLHKTDVEVAIIWLEKFTDVTQFYTHGMQSDKAESIDSGGKNELALKDSTISNFVAIFNSAVDALRSAEISREEANHYARLLGAPVNQISSSVPGSASLDDLQERFNKGYDDLKDRAWSNIMRSTEFSKYLSSKAYTKLMNDFESVKAMSFTEQNIRAFLLGLVNSQAEMNIQMVMDCFDEITRYIPENRAYYRGWKSNAKHKEQAYRVQMTRFIMPRANSLFNTLDYNMMKKLEDFDKVFAMLDGKAECEVSLAWLFSAKLGELCNGKRLSGSYFDVRYYKGIGTIHFFPTNKALIDRLNRLVGKERQWLPDDENKCSKAFWDQYEKAEKVTKEMVLPVDRYNRKFRLDSDEAAEAYMEAHLAACEKVGIDVATMLEHSEAL